MQICVSGLATGTGKSLHQTLFAIVKLSQNILWEQGAKAVKSGKDAGKALKPTAVVHIDGNIMPDPHKSILQIKTK